MSRFKMSALIGFAALPALGLIIGGCSNGVTPNGNANTNVNTNTNDNGGGDTGDPIDVPTEGIIADHLAANAFDSIPMEYVEIAQSDFRIYYGHTSHGSQILTGMDIIQNMDSDFSFNLRSATVNIEEEDGVDLGHIWDFDLEHPEDQPWVLRTREILENPDNNYNIITWSWCAGVSDNTEEGIDAYLDEMDNLESDYPNVVFIYMTGHLDGSGSSGTLHILNERIRDYCRNNDKVLYDFADIETYDPDGTSHLDPDASDWCEWCTDWCESHSCPMMACDDEAEECAHSQCYNCYRKGMAFWWMMARIAGWSGD